MEPGFTIEMEEGFTLSSESNSKVTLNFTSTREWQTAITNEWLDISPVSGSAGTHEVTLTATSANESGTVRTATVILTSAGLTKEITVRQQTAYYVEPEQDIYHVGVNGETLVISFSTNVDTDELAIYGSKNTWLTQQAQSRAGVSYMLNLTILSNTEGRSRTAYVYFYREAEGKQTLLNMVTIIQDGALQMSPPTFQRTRLSVSCKTRLWEKGFPLYSWVTGSLTRT